MSERINDIDNREETNEGKSSTEILNEFARALKSEGYKDDDNIDLTKYIPIKWLEANEELYYTNDPKDRRNRRQYMDVRSAWEVTGQKQWEELKSGHVSEDSLYWQKSHLDHVRSGADLYCYNGINKDSLHYILPGKELAPYDGSVTLHHFYNEALQYRSAIYVLSTEVKRVPIRDEDKIVKDWESLYKQDPVVFAKKLEEYKQSSCKELKVMEEYHQRQAKKCSTCINAVTVVDDTGVHYRCTLSPEEVRECKTETVNHWE